MSQNDVLGRLAANIKARRTARPEELPYAAAA